MELSAEDKRNMYWAMLLSRRLDERAWLLHRQGKIAFHISAIGHEAAQVGAAYAIRCSYDWVVPYYRDLALMIALGFPPRDVVLGLMGKRDDPCSGGRQMPASWSFKAANIISSSMVVASQAAHAAGIALGIKLCGEERVVLATCGEGATSQGEWYESVNFCAVHKLPVIFLVENNQYALSQNQETQMAVKSASDRAFGLGLPGFSVDGMDIFAVYSRVRQAVEDARKENGPCLIEARVYRITPHSSDDDDRSYRTRQEVEEQKKRDPLILTRTALQKAGVLSHNDSDDLETQANQIVDEAVLEAVNASMPTPEAAAQPVYAQEVQHA